MKFPLATLALIAAAALAGCANTNVAVRAGDPPPLGSSYQSASVHAELNSNPYFSLLFLRMFAAGVERNYSDWRYGPDQRAAPQLDENRAIAERDCSQPLMAPSANLRCK
jgi:hypothetical protein